MTPKPQPSLYNQSFLNDEDFVATFVVRQKELKTLCGRLAATGPEDDGQHQLLIGSRGMGKTSLLRRLAIEITRDPQLTERFIPLMFREEQYNVLHLRDFWQNCGEALAEWAEAHGKGDLAERLDAELCSKAWESDEGAADRFFAEMTALGKRAVLLVDNLDLIIDALKEPDRWTLRKYLQLRGGPIVIGAATQSLRESADREAAFYEFFQPCHLEALSLTETENCMRVLATARGEPGKHVLRVLQTDPARLKVLHRLTGGNPRVLALTYRLLETTDSHDAMGDLERLLDEVTPYYKARIEEYQTPLQRATIDAIALNWDPITTGDLSKKTGEPSTTLSPQLIRLRKDGLIETTETSGSYAGHQIVERFLNIWYLMRHGTRRTKQRMRWLVAFLSSFYTSDDLAMLDQEARSNGRAKHWTRDYADAFEQAKLRAADELRDQLLPGIHKRAEAQPDEELPPFFQDGIAMIRQGISLRESGDAVAAIEAFEAFVARFGDSDLPQLQRLIALTLVGNGIAFSDIGNAAAAIDTYDEVVARFGGSDLPELQESVATAMVSKGVALGEGGDAASAISIFDAVFTRFGNSDHPQLQESVATALVGKSISLSEIGKAAAAIETYDALVARFGESDLPQVQEWVAMALLNKGVVLGDIGEVAVQIETYDALIARFSDSDLPRVQEVVAMAMAGKGLILRLRADSAAAIATFEALIDHFGESDLPRVQELIALAELNKGIALYQSVDTVAAIETYDALLARFGDSGLPPVKHHVAMAMYQKGMALGGSGDEAAEISWYEQSLALMRKLDLNESALDASHIAIQLANKLLDQNIDPARSETLLLEAASYNPLPAYANLFWLYLATGRATEAKELLGKLDSLPATGRELIEAALAIDAENFGEATGHLETALSENLVIASFDFTDDIERLIRIAIAKGFGERLVAWFDETRFGERYAPISVALKAAVHGEKVLLDSNPEVRHAASLIYARLVAGKKPVSSNRKRPRSKKKK